VPGKEYSLFINERTTTRLEVRGCPGSLKIGAAAAIESDAEFLLFYFSLANGGKLPILQAKRNEVL
jgi:hypothetical protein